MSSLGTDFPPSGEPFSCAVVSPSFVDIEYLLLVGAESGVDGTEFTVSATPAYPPVFLGSGVALTLAFAPLAHAVGVAGLVDVVDRDAELATDLEGLLGGGHRAAGPLAVPGDEHDRRLRHARRRLDVGLDAALRRDEGLQVGLDLLAVDLHRGPVGSPWELHGLPGAATREPAHGGTVRAQPVMA